MTHPQVINILFLWSMIFALFFIKRYGPGKNIHVSFQWHWTSPYDNGLNDDTPSGHNNLGVKKKNTIHLNKKDTDRQRILHFSSQWPWTCPSENGQNYDTPSGHRKSFCDVRTSNFLHNKKSDRTRLHRQMDWQRWLL